MHIHTCYSYEYIAIYMEAREAHCLYVSAFLKGWNASDRSHDSAREYSGMGGGGGGGG